jgi:predicted nucleotidyltransferase
MRRNLAGRARERREALAHRLEQARSDARRIIDRIWRNHDLKRIYRWGSLLNSTHFPERSDIDIAIEGVSSAEEFFAILREAEEMTRFSVHIVQMETIHPAYAESIRARGSIVRER